MPEGPTGAWIVALFGLWVLAAPFVLGGTTGTHQIILIAVGILVTVLAVYRGLQPDENVPLPALPLAVIFAGLVTIGSPFLFATGASGLLGTTLVVSGLVFVVLPAMMINNMINKQHAAST